MHHLRLPYFMMRPFCVFSSCPNPSPPPPVPLLVLLKASIPPAPFYGPSMAPPILLLMLVTFFITPPILSLLLLTASLAPPALFLLLLTTSLATPILLLLLLTALWPLQCCCPCFNSISVPSRTATQSMLLKTSLASPTLPGIPSIEFVGTVKNNTLKCLYFVFNLRIICMLEIA